MKTKPTKEIFCANEQKVTEHELTFVNGEFVATCECKRFVKFPGDFNKAQLVKAIEKHEEVNKDQVSQETLDKEADEKLKLFEDA